MNIMKWIVGLSEGKLFGVLVLVVVCISATRAAPNAQAKGVHPSWDSDSDGVNDCEKEGSCDHTVDYSKPRLSSPESGITFSVSFDCQSGNLVQVEKLICGDSKLGLLDGELSDIFHQALTKIDNDAYRKTFKAEQRGWIKGRDECWKEPPVKDCVLSSLERRMAELQARFELVDVLTARRFICENNSANEFYGRFYQTHPPTLILERGDQSVVLYRVPGASGVVYEGRNTKYIEHQQRISVSWGYEKTFDCNVSKKME